ncbi:MAG TPA: hypothetical protein VFO14_00565 [Vicinamibacterales bacterium]|nr:hypothetical protein [Vicinamibacterales bacterium]
MLRGRRYNVSPPDALIFASVSVILMVAALIAAYVPARRAARVDLLTALRQ